MDDSAAPLTRRLTDRLTEWHWTLVDVAIAVLAACQAIVQVAAAEATPRGADWDFVRFAAVTLVCAALPWRRRRPRLALAVIAAGVALLLAMHSASWLAQLATLATYSLAAVAARRESLVWLVGCWVAILAGALIGSGGNVSGAFASGLLLVLVGWLVGENVRENRAYQRAQKMREAEREAERERRVQAAGAEERMRIARELHDALAHAMTVITVRAGVVRMLHGDESEDVHEALRIIEETSRGVLREMRLLLGLLRSTPGAETIPETIGHGIADLPDLLRHAHAAGIEASLTVDGDSRALPPSADHAAYRIAQEALTNVCRHAGPAARASLTISYRTHRLVIEVTDDGGQPCTDVPTSVPAGEGRGLAGMRERVRLLGGELVTAAIMPAGFRVRATLPVAPDTTVAQRP